MFARRSCLLEVGNISETEGCVSPFSAGKWVPEVTSVARDNVRLRPSAHTDGTDFIAVAPRSKNSLTLLKPTRYIGFGPKKRPLPQTISVSVLARNLSRFPKFIAARQ